MSQVDFDVAVKFARIATELDEEKDCLWLPNDTLVNLVSELHSFAQALAGDRMGEIYDQADEVAA